MKNQKNNLLLSSTSISKMDNHSKSDLSREVGGFLIGTIKDRVTTIIDFIPALAGDSKATSFQFSEKDWSSLYKTLDNYDNLELVGWFHTHPDFGAFLSSYDQFIQDSFFSDFGRVAIVFDPIREDWAAFLQSNETTEKIQLKADIQNLTTTIQDKQKVSSKKSIFTNLALFTLIVTLGIYTILSYFENIELQNDNASLIIEYDEQLVNFDKSKKELIEEYEQKIQIQSEDYYEQLEKSKSYEKEVTNLESQILTLESEISNFNKNLETEEIDDVYFNYTVREGDTLNIISIIFNTTINEVYELNKTIIGEDLDLIETGTVLTIKIKR